MTDFINTIDDIGDDAVVDGFIDRSITEFEDDVLTAISANVFQGCNNLVEVSLPNVTSLHNAAFYACSALENAHLPSVTTIPYDCFNGCSALKSFDGTNVTSVGGNAFRACTSLETVYFPKATSIPSFFAYDCAKLANVEMPLVKSIGERAFEAWNMPLSKLDLHVCTSINGYRTFRGSWLKTLILRSETLCVLNGNNEAFYNTPIAGSTGYIYVPRALVDSYKAATNWSNYAARFRALEDYTVDGTITGELDETKI